VQIEYFARWNWLLGHGLDPLSDKQLARIHGKGDTYVAHLPDEHLLLTLRPENGYVALRSISPSGPPLSGVALVLDGAPTIESIDVRQGGDEVVRLQGGHGPTLTVTTAPFDQPTEFTPRPLPALRFPAPGDYSDLVKLPRDPWAYVELPDGFDPPRPRP
jgi:hypothetical protein